MEYLVICAVALTASGLTFFSGFGLGTILMPVLVLFLPIPVAIAATAIVHFANNIFKLLLVGKAANKTVLLRFAVPAVIAALFGAWLLAYASAMPAIASYQLGGAAREISAIKLLIGLVIVMFACMELMPGFAAIGMDRRYLPLGGLLSGFFGGLSGNQGALRAIFLLKAGLNKEEFIATGVAAAALVDAARLSVYGASLFAENLNPLGDVKWLMLLATLSAFAGSFFGRQLLKKVTLRTVQLIVGALLILSGTALALGLI